MENVTTMEKLNDRSVFSLFFFFVFHLSSFSVYGMYMVFVIVVDCLIKKINKKIKTNTLQPACTKILFSLPYS